MSIKRRIFNNREGRRMLLFNNALYNAYYFTIIKIKDVQIAIIKIKDSFI